MICQYIFKIIFIGPVITTEYLAEYKIILNIGIVRSHIWHGFRLILGENFLFSFFAGKLGKGTKKGPGGIVDGNCLVQNLSVDMSG